MAQPAVCTRECQQRIIQKVLVNGEQVLQLVCAAHIPHAQHWRSEAMCSERARHIRPHAASPAENSYAGVLEMVRAERSFAAMCALWMAAIEAFYPKDTEVQAAQTSALPARAAPCTAAAACAALGTAGAAASWTSLVGGPVVPAELSAAAVGRRDALSSASLGSKLVGTMPSLRHSGQCSTRL